MLPVYDHVPVVGSYISQVFKGASLAVIPPTTSTLPSDNPVAVCRCRAVFKAPVLYQISVD